MPKISVIIPTYNRAGVVRRAIDSILTQDFEDFELIVVDDGSNDATPEIIEAVRDPRLRYLRQLQNLGGNAARNRGIHEARSPLISFLDSDDTFLPNKLGFIIRYFSEHPQADILFDSYQLVYPPKTRKAPVERVNPALLTSREIEEAIFTRRLYKATPAISARRDALIAAGLFDETLKRRQDMDIALRLTRSGRCHATSQVLWIKHWSKNSISARQDTVVTSMIEICKRHPDYLIRPEFRVGLARDMARRFLRLMCRGHIRMAHSDLVDCVGFFGWRRTFGLVGAGLIQMSRQLTGAMTRKTSPRYSPEARARAVRMVQEHRWDYPSESVALGSIAAKIGCTAETLRGWVRQLERDQGLRGDTTREEEEERLKAQEAGEPRVLAGQ